MSSSKSYIAASPSIERMDAAELFKRLESNQPQVVEEIKSTFHELFNTTKDSWLLNGLFDYYLATNSTRAVEVLLAVREPHDKFLLDRITEALRGTSRLQALTLLGHVVRKQPAWLFKITQHSLLSQLLKLLKAETDILPMMSALLVLIILLPMIPGYLASYLQEIFEIFCRVASWNTLNPAKLSEAHLVHLQVGLYALFLRLYGMFPCNFLAFLRQQYGQQENLNIFRHTIKPMLDSVKMHPLLVTASKDAETMQERWKNKGHHDVIVECAKFALERMHCHGSMAYAEAGLMSSNRPQLEAFVTEEKPVHASPTLRLPTELWSPSMLWGLSTPPTNDISLTPVLQNYNTSHHKQEGSSPPEAAIEATPETTPVKDTRVPPRVPAGSAVKRALALTGKVITNSSPTTSTPSSPLKKEASPFRFAPDELRTNSALQKMVQERQKVVEACKNGAVENQVVLEDVTPTKTSILVDSILHDSHPTRTLEGETGEYEECSDSLCASGGLHMPNKQSFIDFARRVNRLRVHSVCVPFPALSAGTSPIEGAAFPKNTKVRRTVSCPDMKRNWIISASNSVNSPVLVEKEEEESKNEIIAVNGSISERAIVKQEAKQCFSFGTQTSGEQWPSQPYEHLFLAVFPSSPEVSSQEPFFCPNSLLDEYIKSSSIEHSQKYTDSKKSRTQELEAELKSLRGQLHLLHLQLQFERHRREVHAERNRRLTGKSRSNRALEEHNAALKEQVVLLQKDYEKLQYEVDLKRQKMVQVEKKNGADIQFWKNKFDEMHKENRQLNLINEELRIKLSMDEESIQRLNKELAKAQSVTFDLNSELRQLQECATMGERLGGEISQLQREMILLGEIQQRQLDHFTHLPLLAQHKEEALRVKESCREEISTMRQQLECRTSNLEAVKMRASELELLLNKKDALLLEEKKLLKTIKDEYSAKLNAIEDKYRAVRAINLRLEEEIINLYHKIEILDARTAPKQTSKKQQQSSPLSNPLTTVTATTEITDLHSIIVERDLPPTSQLHSPTSLQSEVKSDPSLLDNASAQLPLKKLD